MAASWPPRPSIKRRCLPVAFVLLGLVAGGLYTARFVRTAFVGYTCPASRCAGVQRRQPRVVAQQAFDDEDGILVNDEISAVELRIVAEFNGNTTVEVNKIMSIEEARERANDLGTDIIQFMDGDPPLAKFMRKHRFYTEADKLRKSRAKKAKAPAMKEVKMSYTIGIGDLKVHCNRMEKWFDVSKPGFDNRQQVKVLVQLKGRARAFERQARALLTTVRRETASFCKAGAGDYSKDGRGDVFMVMTSGPDVQLLRQIREEVEAAALELEDEEEEDEEEDEEDDDEDDPPASEEIRALLAEIEEMREELLDCGIPKSKVNSEPEIQELQAELRKLQAADQ